MITFTHKGCKASIRNDDWKKLKERFNPDNARKVGDFWSMDLPCSLCMRYKDDNKCTRCPLSCMEDEFRRGCGSLVKSLFPALAVELFEDGLKWSLKDNRKAHRQLKAIIRRMEKIEQNQEEK